MAVQEESTKKEVSELRGLLEKYLRGSDSKGNPTPDATVIESREEGKASNRRGPP